VLSVGSAANVAASADGACPDDDTSAKRVKLEPGVSVKVEPAPAAAGARAPRPRVINVAPVPAGPHLPEGQAVFNRPGPQSRCAQVLRCAPQVPATPLASDVLPAVQAANRFQASSPRLESDRASRLDLWAEP